MSLLIISLISQLSLHLTDCAFRDSFAGYEVYRPLDLWIPFTPFKTSRLTRHSGYGYELQVSCTGYNEFTSVLYHPVSIDSLCPQIVKEMLNEVNPGTYYYI